MTAINAAIEVDLAGNINAETYDGPPVGRAGGLLDFSRGARASVGGQAIIALRATDHSGAVGRIVSRVGSVTAPKTDADVIVTEYGVAQLRDLGLAERAKALVAIAVPKQGESLARAIGRGAD